MLLYFSQSFSPQVALSSRIRKAWLKLQLQAVNMACHFATASIAQRS
jgi:hypothetical protein